jgi:Cu+-exporting ATPase
MYDVHGKSVDGADKGRMQQAVDEWERSARETTPSMPEREDDEEPDSEIRDKIKNNIRVINSAKATQIHEAVNQGTDSSGQNPADVNMKETISSGFELSSHELGRRVAAKKETVLEDSDYNSDKHDKDILSDQNMLFFAFTIRFIGSLLCAGILVWLAAAPVINKPLPFLSMASHPSSYIIANLILLLAAGIFGFPVAIKGIVSFFALKPDTDSLTSLAFYAAFLGGIYTIYNSAAATSATAIYSSCAAACIAFNLLGKMFLIARVRCNLKLIASEEIFQSEFYAAQQVEPVAAQGVLKTFQGVPSIIRPEKVKSLSSYLEQSYMESPADSAAKVLSPIVFAVAVCAAVLEYLFKGGIPQTVAVFTAICCISSPLLLEAGVSVPFYRACKRLLKQKALVAGCDTVLQYGGTDSIVADGSLIFPGQNIRIHSVKTLSGHDIKESVLYASSIASAGKSPLSNALLGIFADVGSSRKLLKECEKIVYEDERGLSAIIDGKVVLLGNRGILRHHLIEAPSRDFEIRNTSNGKDIVYLAIEGEICAIFIVGYETENKMPSVLHKLHRYGIQLLIESTDPNITPLLLEEKCGMVVANTEMLGAREMQILGEPVNNGSRQAGLAFLDLDGYVSAVIACIKLKGSIKASTALQILSSVFGILLVIYTAFFASGILTVTPLLILAFQALCAVPVLLIAVFRRN